MRARIGICIRMYICIQKDRERARGKEREREIRNNETKTSSKQYTTLLKTQIGYNTQLIPHSGYKHYVPMTTICSKTWSKGSSLGGRALGPPQSFGVNHRLPR